MTDVVSFANSTLGTYLIGAIATLGLWAYHRARGDKTASLRSTLGGVVDNAIHAAMTKVEATTTPAELREAALPYVWNGLTRVKVPRNAMTTAIVNELLEVAIADAIHAAKDRFDSGIAANVKAAQDEARKPAPPAPIIPKLDQIETTIVPRDGTEEFKPVGGQL